MSNFWQHLPEASRKKRNNETRSIAHSGSRLTAHLHTPAHFSEEFIHKHVVFCS